MHFLIMSASCPWRGDLAADAAGEHIAAGSAGVLLTLTGRGILTAPTVLAAIDGVTAIRQLDDETD